MRYEIHHYFQYCSPVRALSLRRASRAHEGEMKDSINRSYSLLSRPSSCDCVIVSRDKPTYCTRMYVKYNVKRVHFCLLVPNLHVLFAVQLSRAVLSL